MATIAGSVLDDAEVTSRLDAEYRQAHKLDKPRLPFKVCYFVIINQQVMFKTI